MGAGSLADPGSRERADAPDVNDEPTVVLGGARALLAAVRRVHRRGGPAAGAAAARARSPRARRGRRSTGAAPRSRRAGSRRGSSSGAGACCAGSTRGSSAGGGATGRGASSSCATASRSGTSTHQRTRERDDDDDARALALTERGFGLARPRSSDASRALSLSLRYETTPDSLISLTERGFAQGAACGLQLRQLVGDESVRFYHAPYLRTRQTLLAILEAFAGKRVELASEPRLREQDFGNFQNASVMRDASRTASSSGGSRSRFANGEAGTDVFDRMSDFLSSLFLRFDGAADVDGRTGAPLQSAENLVLVLHGLLMRIFCMAYFKWTCPGVRAGVEPDQRRDLGAREGAVGRVRVRGALARGRIRRRVRRVKARERENVLPSLHRERVPSLRRGAFVDASSSAPTRSSRCSTT